MSLKTLRSLRSKSEVRNCGSFIFLTISVLTFLYTIVKASYVGITLRDTMAPLVFSFLQYITSTAIVLLKISTVLFTGLKFPRMCITFMVIHIMLDIVVTTFAFLNEIESMFIPLLATLSSFMDLGIYSLFLRVQKGKTY